MSREYKYKNWHNLAMSAFDTLNPQDLTYFYLGSAAEGLGFYKSALNYYNKAISVRNGSIDGEKRTCQGMIYDDCNELDFPSDINKAINIVNVKIKKVERLKKVEEKKDRYDNRPRNVTIKVDKPNAFFIVDNRDKLKSPSSLKLKPGVYDVRYFTDTLFAKRAINVHKKEKDSVDVQLKFKEDPEFTLSIDYLNEMNREGKERLLQLEGTGKKFGGIGIRFIIENNAINVVSVVNDGPAYKAGLKSGDIIKSIDGKVIYADSLESAVTLLKGKVGSKVVISVQRKEKVLNVNITRGTIHNVNTMDDLPSLISWYKGTKKQKKAIETIYGKLDKQTSLYKATKKHLAIFYKLFNSIENKIFQTETKDFFEYNKLVETLANKNISFSKVPLKVPLYNDAQLKGRDLYSTVALNNLNCKSYVIVTKDRESNTRLIDSKKSQHSSQYIQEYRDIPNNRYSELKSQLREARYALDDFNYESSNSTAGGLGAWGAIALGVMQGVRGDQLEENINNIQSQLSNTSRIIRKEIKGTYYPTKKNVAFNQTQSFEWMSINCINGRVNTYKTLKEENKDFVLYEGVRSDDLNSLSATNQSTKNRMRQWNNKLFLSLDDIENEDDNYLLSSTIINNDINSIKSKVKQFLSRN
jgi:hypothetical protein